MRRFAILLSAAATLALAACDSGPANRRAAAAQTLQTVNSIPPRPAALEPPPMLSDEAPPPKPKTLPWETATPIVFTPEDEKVRGALPFTPAIAMDPIDGSKLSIRAATPTFEYKGKIYYFATEENKRTFAANPDGILKGGFTKL
ncbi:MAG TPA: YHS domain-containing protein [Thermoanaerobaculia bacterium]|jgi:YHS domain-containing protein